MDRICLMVIAVLWLLTLMFSGNGNLSGMTFINFLISAIAVAANVVSNINSNQRNNNNNNNNNNDNVANFNFANNNNAGNNMNTIAICE